MNTRKLCGKNNITNKEDDCATNGSTGKVAPWGVLIYS